MTIGFHPLANQELTEAGRFYEARAEGLGSRFLDAAERAVHLLEAHPELGRPLSKSIRGLPVPQFPYTVVYRVESDRTRAPILRLRRKRPRSRNPIRGEIADYYD